MRAHRERPSVQERFGYDESQRRWAALIDRYDAVAQRLFNKPALSWSHVAELAEVAWFWAPKDTRVVSIGPEPALSGFDYYTGQLALDPKCGFGHAQYHNSYELAANAALIEAVLALSGGRRSDCRMDDRMEGWWLDCPDWVDAMEAANA